MMSPWNKVVLPRVAELPTCQNTFLAWTPGPRMTWLLPAAGGKVGNTWKVKKQLIMPAGGGVVFFLLTTAGGVCFPSYICFEDGPSGYSRSVVIGDGQVSLGRLGNCIARVLCAAKIQRRKPSDRRPRPYTNIPSNERGHSAIGDRGTAQNSETAGRSYWGNG